MDGKQKLRILYIAKMLREETDDDHTLTIGQINQRLEEQYGLKGYRQTIDADVRALRDLGMDIQIVRRRENEYNLLEREFSEAELKLLMDAVASSRFISAGKSRQLNDKLLQFSSCYRAPELKRHISVERRFKTGSEIVFLVIDRINEAINRKKKISFTYFSYDGQKKQVLRNGGEPYRFSPYHLIWNGDYYYAVGYSDKHEKIACFRVDRIQSVPEILEEKAVRVPKNFSISEYLNTTFRMFDSEREEVELECDDSVMNSIVDRFGKSVSTTKVENGKFRVRVTVALSPVFYSWIFGFAGQVKILSPQNVKEHYAEMVRKAGQTLK